MTTKLLIQAITKFILGVVLVGLLLFLPAGTFLYMNGWLFMGILFIPSFARIIRSEMIRCRELDFVKSARIMGASDFRIIFVHILPNAAVSMLTTMAIGFNNAVLAEASMSYLGLGIQPPQPSLGRMLSEAQSYFATAPWYPIFPGIAIIVIILGFSLVSEGLRTMQE